MCLIILDPLQHVSYSYHDPCCCTSCRTYHLHTTRQANTILHTNQMIKVKLSKYIGFKFKPQHVNDSSHIKLRYWPLGFSTCLWNLATRQDKSDKDLAVSKSGADQTCSVEEPDMSNKFYWNPALNPDKSGELRKIGWLGHVWAEGQTCPVLIIGIRLGNRICPNFLESLVQRSFFDDLHFTK
jgi:hypothetical protein